MLESRPLDLQRVRFGLKDFARGYWTALEHNETVILVDRAIRDDVLTTASAMAVRAHTVQTGGGGQP